MILTIHLLVSFILAIILYRSYSYLVLFIFLGGFLIDIDHPLYYLIRFKSFNLKKAYSYFMEIGKRNDLRSYESVIRIFHNIETFFVLLIFSFFSKEVLMILIGFILHISLDMISEYRYFSCLRNYSLLRSLIKKQKPL